jgi:hypothetical protein
VKRLFEKSRTKFSRAAWGQAIGYARVPAVENDALGGHFTWLHLAFEAISSSSATVVPVFSNILRSIVMASSPGT